MAEDFDGRFDGREDVAPYLKLSGARRPGMAAKRVNVDLPVRTIKLLDREARRPGVARQSIIKVWSGRERERPRAPRRR